MKRLVLILIVLLALGSLNDPIPVIQAAQFIDNFDTNPYSPVRWINEMGTATWDATNLELDILDDNDTLYRYTTGSPGSIEHEAQVTALAGSAGTRLVGPGVRFDNTGINDAYGMVFEGNSVNFYRWNAGTRLTLLTSPSIGITFTPGNFYSMRLAALGGVGSNVTLNAWVVDHGATKPSDPGWIGSDNIPQATYTDTAANRLDDTVHAQTGIAGRGSSTSYDDRHDYFKVRAISDRGGSLPPPPPPPPAPTPTPTPTPTPVPPPQPSGSAYDCAQEIGLLLCEDFNDNNYTNYLWGGGNETHVFQWTHDANGGWNGGGAAKFQLVQFEYEDDAGLLFDFSPNQNRINVGYMVYYGTNFNPALADDDGYKDVLVYDLPAVDGSHTRPMLMNRHRESGIYTHRVIQACQLAGGGCVDELGLGFGEGTNYTYTPEMYAGQYVYYEFETVIGGNNTVYIYTQNGVKSGFYASVSSLNTRLFDYARILAYMEGAGVDAIPITSEGYVKIDNVRIANHFMGPPAGFVSSTTPIAGDLNLDHIVNSLDWSIMNSRWLTNDAAADLNDDGIVNTLDYSILNANWFRTW